jgi:hypothetical protein
MFRRCLWLTLLIACCIPAAGQAGFNLRPGLRSVDLPFEYDNNFIIVTLILNGRVPLRFIFDSGAEHTILTKREIGDLFGLRYEREFRVTGSDLKTELVAYLVRQVRLEVPDKVEAPQEDILVLQEDYFRFEEYAGIYVHGILSANAFSRYIIKINYQKRVITLYERELFHQRETGFVPLGVEITRNKIYLQTRLLVRPDSSAQVKLLLDTGAGLPLLLFSNTHPLLQPPPNALESNIGMGLGGYLKGFTGRVHGLTLADYSQNNIVTYFQNLDTVQRRAFLNDRNGLLGNMLLSRFILALDYQKGLIWVKPSRTYRQKFEYDRSGLNLIASGLALNRFSVVDVVPNSPAAEADLRPGDEILRVGLTPATLYSLGSLQRAFQKKAGKRVTITIRRGEEKMKKTIVLRDLI